MPYLSKISSRLKALSKKSASKKSHNRRKILFEALEPRLLLSADPVSASQDLQESKELHPDLVPAVAEFDCQLTESEIDAGENPGPEDTTLPCDGDAQVPDTEVESGNASDTDSTESRRIDGLGSSGSMQEDEEALFSGSQDLTESPETTTGTDNAEDLDPNTTSSNENTTILSDSEISPQAALLLSKNIGQQLIFIDTSVPEYESLFDKFEAGISSAENESETSSVNEEILNKSVAGHMEKNASDSEAPGF
ncbi:MAG: LEPR-XLL domain-containing protein, partial [Deltaproteobacteria bacterium]|nr:LEPR-XLL domain-containing protein [Deltaproteobacteria bacterium]